MSVKRFPLTKVFEEAVLCGWMVLRRLFISLIKVERWGQKHFRVKCFLQIFFWDWFWARLDVHSNRALCSALINTFTRRRARGEGRQWKSWRLEIIKRRAAGTCGGEDNISFSCSSFFLFVRVCVCSRFPNNVLKRLI